MENNTTSEIDKKGFDLQCEHCNCKNIKVVKEGFCGLYAVIGFIIGSIIGGIFLYIGLSMNDVYMTKILCGIACCLPLLGFFFGTVQMNDIIRVCLNCGKKTLLIYRPNNK
jgi:hypothetical protein